MSYTYPTVTLTSGSNTFTYAVYGDVVTADAYLEASITASGVAWRAATEDTKSRALVSATRWLDSAGWVGEKTEEDQELAWPRTGVDGVEDDVIPDAVTFASFELAAAMVADPDLQTSQSQPGIREEHAGPVGHTFFRATVSTSDAMFPQSVMALIGKWLEGAGASGGALSFGTDRCPTDDRTFEVEHGI